jgi:mono/diheme cytochrome c family protein
MNRAATITAMALMLAGCDQNMDAQPKYNSYSEAPLFRGSSLRPPPAGTVARGDAERERDIRTKPAMTRELLARGQNRFQIYCTPCHGQTGEGNGMVVQRGMPHPTSYFDPRLLAADDQHFFDVITNGYGAMYSYASRVEPRDRWAIVAYIRALQRSRHASLDDVPADARAKLEASP